MLRRSIPVLMLALSAAMSLPAQTSTGTKPTPPTPAQAAANHVNQLTQLLTLTSSQQTQATTIYTAEETTVAGLRDSMTTARTAETTAVENNDTAGITAAATQIGALTTQRVEAQGQADAAFFLILTATQQTTFKQLLTSGPGGFGGGRGGFAHGPGPGGPPPAN